MSLSYCPSSILLAVGSSQMSHISLCAELTEWTYEWKPEKKKSQCKPLKALHLFITSGLMTVVNSKALLQSCSCKPVLFCFVFFFLHSQKACCFCCCWQIDLQANTEVLFFKRSLSVFIRAAGSLHGNQVWKGKKKKKSHTKTIWKISFLHLILILRLFIFLCFSKGCICAAHLTTKKHPGSPAEENQYLNYAVVGQHVWVYKIKWGLKLISNSPWRSLQVFWNETERRSSATERQWPPPRASS